MVGNSNEEVTKPAPINMAIDCRVH